MLTALNCRLFHPASGITIQQVPKRTSHFLSRGAVREIWTTRHSDLISQLAALLRFGEVSQVRQNPGAGE